MRFMNDNLLQGGFQKCIPKKRLAIKNDKPVLRVLEERGFFPNAQKFKWNANFSNILRIFNYLSARYES